MLLAAHAWQWLSSTHGRHGRGMGIWRGKGWETGVACSLRLSSLNLLRLCICTPTYRKDLFYVSTTSPLSSTLKRYTKNVLLKKEKKKKKKRRKKKKKNIYSKRQGMGGRLCILKNIYLYLKTLYSLSHLLSVYLSLFSFLCNLGGVGMAALRRSGWR